MSIAEQSSVVGVRSGSGGTWVQKLNQYPSRSCVPGGRPEFRRPVEGLLNLISAKGRRSCSI
jgi:hypothetical protein